MLLEKPSTSNAIEAEHLFRSNLFRQGQSTSETDILPVLLEAFHTRFHPAFRKFQQLIEPANVVEGHASLELIKGIVNTGNDIRMDYDLSGGSLMDCGTYAVLMLRHIFQEEPVECTEVCFMPFVLTVSLHFE